MAVPLLRILVAPSSRVHLPHVPSPFPHLSPTTVTTSRGPRSTTRFPSPLLPSSIYPSRIRLPLFLASLKVNPPSVQLTPHQVLSQTAEDVAELTLELLEWPRLLQVLSSFAGTPSAKEIIQNSKLPLTQLESENLLSETAAAIDLLAFLGSSLDFGGVRSTLVKSCIIRLQKGFVIMGKEAVAILMLLQCTDTMQRDIKMDMNQIMRSNNILNIFLDTICTLGSQTEVTKFIMKTVDEDGNVKDSASSDLQRARVQYRLIQTKIQEQIRSIFKDHEGTAMMQEVDGRYCIVTSSDNQKKYPGLLLQSGIQGSTSYIEPIALVALNDKLAETRALILKAEHEALKVLTEKLLPHLENIAAVLDAVVQLDVVVARAKYSLMNQGSRPIFTTSQKLLDDDGADVISHKGLLLKLDQLQHPLLLYQYQEQVRVLKRRSRRQVAPTIPSPPVPINIYIAQETRVVTITGPNTGGKTAAMKTLGLACLMAKYGLFVLAKDPVYLPWFDAVFADIGDEQSLSKSLSTFSGHLKRINDIKKLCTGKSLVLLDEVGTGSNPMEGAALGMAILESFATNGEGGARLTIASTHHPELKTLKYSDRRFENASVEFNEETLKPTYRLLWGIPGRSNALNISERLGVPKHILQNARKHLGTATTEINQVIMDLEKSKLDFENNLLETEKYVKQAKELHEGLKEAAENLWHEEQSSFRAAAGILQEAARKARAALTAIHLKKLNTVEKKITAPLTESRVSGTSDEALIQVGDKVHVPRLGKDARVVQVLEGKQMLVVQSGSMQLRLSFSDVKKNSRRP